MVCHQHPQHPQTRGRKLTLTPTTIILIRHGETDWNIERRYQGQDGPGLNDTGRAQAQQIAEHLQNGSSPTALYSSDLTRAIQTAEVIGAVLNLAPQPDPRLRERHFGAWQGFARDDIAEAYEAYRLRWDAAPLDVAPPDGETWAEVLARFTESLNAIAADHPGETVGVVSHGGSMAILRCYYDQISPLQIGERRIANTEAIPLSWPPAHPLDAWMTTHRLNQPEEQNHAA